MVLNIHINIIINIYVYLCVLNKIYAVLYKDIKRIVDNYNELYGDDVYWWNVIHVYHVIHEIQPFYNGHSNQLLSINFFPSPNYYKWPDKLFV